MKLTYEEKQNKCGISVGDMVRITKKATGHTKGWSNSWTPQMTRAIGKFGKVTHIQGASGINVTVEGCDNYGYPYWVLSKKEIDTVFPVDVKLNDSYTATISESGVKVGCQTFTFKKVADLADAVMKFQIKANALAVKKAKKK
jgi:hypothetical protein